MGGRNPQFVGEVYSLSGRLVIDSAGNVLPPIAGNGRVFYVNSVNGNNAFDGRSALTAKATLANIAGDLAANDIVYIAPAHAETVSAAGMITIAASNVRIYGMGSANEKPVFTFSTVAATFAVTGNNVALVNIAGTTSIDLNTNPFNITGDDFYGDLEWRDGSNVLEALRAVRLDTANRCYLKLKYNGFTNGDGTVNAVRLDDCDHVRIDIDAFGLVGATGWVEFVDVASINVYVRGYFFTQGITTLARNVVDTITGSSWYVDGYDGSAGAPFNGGSGNPIAAGDLSVIATGIGGVADAALADTIEGAAAATQSLLTDVKGALQRIGADNANNTAATTLVAANDDGSVLERLEGILQRVNGTDGATNVLGADDADNLFASTNVAANRDGSILERLEDLRANEGFAAGLVYQGTCDAGMGASTTVVVSADLAGRGDDFYNTKYYMMILRNANGAGAAPENEVRQITDYASATGTFTCTAFSVNVEASDSILVMHESLVVLGRDDANNTMATTNVVANVDGSVLERLEDIVVKVTAVDDLIDTEIGVIDGFHDVPGADAAANAQMRDVIGNKTDTNAGNSLLARHLVQTADAATNANMRDVVGNKADAAAAGDVSAVESLMAYAKQAVTELSGTAGITTFPAAAAPANGVALADVLREIYDQEEKVATNAAAILSNNATVFTIAGGPIEILSLVARCVTGNDATASTLQWQADPTDGAAVTITAASASLGGAAAGALVVFQGTTLATAPTVNASGAGLGQTVTNGVIVGAGIIQTVIGVGSTTGTWMHHLRYRPLARGVTVTGSA